jgi:hypothetical protein
LLTNFLNCHWSSIHNGTIELLFNRLTNIISFEMEILLTKNLITYIRIVNRWVLSFREFCMKYKCVFLTMPLKIVYWPFYILFMPFKLTPTIM